MFRFYYQIDIRNFFGFIEELVETKNLIKFYLHEIHIAFFLESFFIF